MSALMSAPPASTAPAALSSHHLPDTDVPNDFQLMMEMARELANAEHFLPTELQGKPGNVLALMLRARALNIPFAVACDELYIQKRSNKVAQSARLVRALARRAGHKFMTLVADRHHCVLLILLKGESEPRRVEFTMQDAHRMGLTDPSGNNKGGQWDKQPENMLYARCTTRAVSRYCPEVMLGMGSDFLYEESPAEDEVARDQEDVLAAFQEEDKRLIVQVLAAAADTDHLDSGEERESTLMKLGMDYPQILNYAADESQEFTVRQVLLGKMRDARDRKEKQARGEEVPAPKPFPQGGSDAPSGAYPDAEVVGEGDGPARARKAAGGRAGARARAAEDKAARPVKAAPAKKAAAKKAPAKKAAAKKAAAKVSAVRPKKQPTQEPTQVGAVEAVKESARRAATPDERTLPCGCPAEQVLFNGNHSKTCKEVTQ